MTYSQDENVSQIHETCEVVVDHPTNIAVPGTTLTVMTDTEFFSCV